MKKVYLLGLLAILISTKSFSQISFTPDQTFACLPATINFTNSSAMGDSYVWYFGDNGVSTSIGIGSGISHVYDRAGVYSVMMEAYSGATYLGSAYGTVTIEGMSTKLWLTDSTICPSDEIGVDFGTNQASNVNWNFGDGVVLNNTSYYGIRHVYNTVGTYTLTVSATFPNCGVQSRSANVYVGTNYPFDVNYPLSINLYDDTICPNDKILLETPYEYSNFYTVFGDGYSAHAEKEHEYQSPGIYPIKVTLYNGCGFSLNLYDTAYVSNGLPVQIDPNFNITNESACINTNIDLGFPNYPSFESYYWNFGNGNTSNSQSASISYPTPGMHLFSLTLTNGCGNSAMITDTIIISNNLPVMGLQIEQPYLTELCPGDEYFLSVEVSGGYEWFDFLWDFGDGSFGDDFYTTHSYDLPGTYIVSVTATNFCGNSATLSDTVLVANNIFPNPLFYEFGVPSVGDNQDQLFCPNDSLPFIFGPGSPSANVFWDFGDGNTGFASNNLVVQGQTYNFVNHSYDSPGVYIAEVTYTNGCGNSFSDTISVTIAEGVQPTAGFFEDPLVYNCQGQPVQFLTLGGNTFIWDFGDGSGYLITHSPVVPVEHIFENPGTYTVSLEVFNGCGLSAEAENDILIPESLLEITTNSVDASCGLSDGKAIAVVEGGSVPYSYQWSNGDMSFLADSIPAGIYVVNVEDKNGCKNFAIATVSDSEAPTILTSAVVDVNCNGNNSGAIDISVIGGSAPYNYVWSNGSLTQDVNQLEAGPHEIILTDANGCIATASIVVNEPGEVIVSPFSQNADCGLANGEAAIAVSGSTGPYNFLWSNGYNQQLATGLSAGIYHVVVVDANGCIFEESVTVSEDELNIVLDSITGTGCTGDLASIYIRVLPGGNYSYDWSNSSTTEDISNLNTGVYSVEVTDNSTTCKAFAEFTIDDIPTNGNEICIVSVDSISNTNKVIWEKDLSATNISHYNIYKESSQAGVYYLVDEVPFDSLSSWVDPVSNPQVRSWRYKISVVDDCGNESNLSGEHKTIHLTVNEGINSTYNLIWDHYDGLTYSTYEIYRKTNGGTWINIASLPSNLNSYTDATPPAGTEYYRVEAITSASCDATRAGVNTSRSNVRNTPGAAPFGESIDESYLELINVYPNPTTGIFHIEMKQSGEFNLDVYNSIGEKVSGGNINDNTIIDLTKFADGIYFIQIMNDKKSKTIKIIKN